MTTVVNSRLKVSVIIPSFRPGAYVIECLDSIINQTLRRDDYEVIIVLNGEKEPYLSMLNNKIACHNNMRVIYTSESGVSNARNIGLDIARGEYIAFLDDDDFVSSQYLEVLLECVQKQDGTIACSDVKTLDMKGDIGEDYISRAFKRALQKPVSTSVFKRRSFLSSSCCKLIPVKVISNRRFNSNIRLSEDALFMASISDKIESISISNGIAIYYRRLRAGSATRSQHNYLKKVLRKISLIKLFATIYIKGFPHYNFPFFLTRIIAVSIK